MSGLDRLMFTFLVLMVCFLVSCMSVFEDIEEGNYVVSAFNGVSFVFVAVVWYGHYEPEHVGALVLGILLVIFPILRYKKVL